MVSEIYPCLPRRFNKGKLSSPLISVPFWSSKDVLATFAQLYTLRADNSICFYDYQRNTRYFIMDNTFLLSVAIKCWKMLITFFKNYRVIQILFWICLKKTVTRISLFPSTSTIPRLYHFTKHRATINSLIKLYTKNINFFQEQSSHFFRSILLYEITREKVQFVV